MLKDNKMKKIKNVRRTYVFILLIMCLISFGLGYYVFSKFNTKEVRHLHINDSITLNAIPVKSGDFEIKNTYIGHTMAINQVNITPYVSGYLNKIIIKQGDFVKKGEELLVIDPKEYEAKLMASEALVFQAIADFRYNRNYYERVMKSGKNSFSETQIDEAKNKFLQADANLKNAIANKKVSEVDFGYTIIKAPIDGKIGNFDLSIGDFVSPQNGGIIDIVQINPIRVVFSISDREYFKFFKNNDSPFKDSVIKLKTADGSFFENNGTFKYTDNKIDKKTNSLAIYADFENNNNLLLPNTFVNIEVYQKISNAISIDKNIVIMKEKGNFINIARDEKIKTIPIDILAEEKDKYIIHNNFKNSDLVILDNIDNIKEGAVLEFNIVK